MKTKYIGNMRAYEQALMDCEEIMERIDHVGQANDDLPFLHATERKSKTSAICRKKHGKLSRRCIKCCARLPGGFLNDYGLDQRQRQIASGRR